MNNPRILIIEDEEDISALLKFRLVKAGYEITLEEDGQAGLQTAKEIKPDLIILDLTLPELPGEEVCKAIREDSDETFAQTPIIMVTAKIGDVDRIIGKSLGANEYITKPFEFDKVLEEIEKQIKGSSSSS